MQVVHITTTGVETPDDVVLVEAVLRMLAGIADVAAVRSLGLVSVLYDEQQIAPRTVPATEPVSSGPTASGAGR